MLVFEDADIVSSVEDCVLHLWPKLVEGCRFYSHEPWSAGVVAIFYDKLWWRERFGVEPPGFYGSGKGIGSCVEDTMIGYAAKTDPRKLIREGTRIVHAGSRAGES